MNLFGVKRREPVNKTLSKKYEGVWTYDRRYSWRCDDGIRHVDRVAGCMCDEPCNHPPRYYMYGVKPVIQLFL